MSLLKSIQVPESVRMHGVCVCVFVCKCVLNDHLDSTAHTAAFNAYSLHR